LARRNRQVVDELAQILLEERQRSERLRGTLAYIARYAAGEAAEFQQDGLGTPARAWAFIASRASDEAGGTAANADVDQRLRELGRGELLEQAVELLRHLRHDHDDPQVSSAIDLDWRPVGALLDEYDRHRGLL
jgi:hypothetical protein